MPWLQTGPLLAGACAASFLLVLSAASDSRPTLAEYRKGTEKRFGVALDAAADHLAWFLGVSKAARTGKRSYPNVFKRYELDISDSPIWREDCAFDVEAGHDQLEWCAARKLQALEALCMEPRLVVRAGKQGLVAALKALDGQRKTIQGLGLRRDAPPGSEHRPSEGFVFEVGRVGSGQKLLSPMLQAVAMSAITRCGAILGFKDYVGFMPPWFAALDSAVETSAKANYDNLSHHNLAVVLESLVYLLAAAKPTGTAKADAKHALKLADGGVRGQFNESEAAWSYAGASALALQLGGTQGKRRAKLEKLGRAYASRFMEKLLPNMDTSLYCMCGPITGLAPLAAELADAQLAEVVLQMMDKNIELFQVAEDGSAKASADRFEADGAALRGAFLRSPRQLQMEQRPHTLRIDDTLTCLSALGATMRMAEAMLRAEAPKATAATEEL